MVDQDRLRQALREMKQRLNNDPELMARFDLNGDGRIDGLEWEAVRAFVIEELEHEQQQMARLDIRDDEAMVASSPNIMGARAGGGGAVIYEEDPFNRASQSVIHLRTAGALMLVSFLLPWVYFNMSISGMGISQSQSQMVWAWDMLDESTGIFLYFLPVMGLALIGMSYSSLDTDRAIAIGGGIGLGGIATFFFHPIAPLMRKLPQGTGNVASSDFGDIYVLLFVGILVLFFANHHAIRRPESSLARIIAAGGAITIIIAMLIPAEMPGLEGAQQAGAQERMILFTYFKVGGDVMDEEALSFGVTFWAYVMALAHSALFLGAVATLASFFTRSDEDRQATIDVAVRRAVLLFFPIFMLAVFMMFISIAGSLEDMLAKQGAGMSIEFSFLLSGLLWTGFLWSAYMYIGAAGVSLLLHNEGERDSAFGA